MPYNYVIDPFIRQTLTFELSRFRLNNFHLPTRSILIFDEAHNLESVCSDASSFELSTKQLTDAIKEVQMLIDSQEGKGKTSTELGDEFNAHDLVKLKRKPSCRS